MKNNTLFYVKRDILNIRDIEILLSISKWLKVVDINHAGNEWKRLI